MVDIPLNMNTQLLCHHLYNNTLHDLVANNEGKMYIDIKNGAEHFQLAIYFFP